MKKSSRQESIIVNNFFTLASIVMIAITIILYSKYIVADKKPKEIEKQMSKESYMKVADVLDLDFLEFDRSVT